MRAPTWDRLTISGISSTVLTGAELLVLTTCALLITRPYLNLDPSVAPAGREFLSVISPHHFWTWARQCGWCALWNGNANGGSPALANSFPSTLHPLVILTTLGWGVLNGSKLALAGSFLMAGLAQWWLGRVLVLGRLARVWTSIMAMSAGCLAGRMEAGDFGLVLSTAACALVLPPFVALMLMPSRRNAVLLAVALALAALAGQGYMQVGLALSLPAALFLAPWERRRALQIARRLALAAGLAFLLAAPFVVPFLHFMREFQKYRDPTFRVAQPFAFVPLNLLIDDHQFYRSYALGKAVPYPSLYANFIGWIPVVFAVVGIWAGRKQHQRRLVGFLLAFAVLALWVASAQPLRGIARILPVPSFVDLITSVRNSPFIAGLAVTPILALAGMGADLVLDVESWPRLGRRRAAGSVTPAVAPKLSWLLVIPLLFAVWQARVFQSPYIATITISSDVQRVLGRLRTTDLQWVNVPPGEHLYVEQAVGMGLKLSDSLQPWHWHDRPEPGPALEVNFRDPPAGMTRVAMAARVPYYIPPNDTFDLFDPKDHGVLRGVPIYAAPDRQYCSVVESDGSRLACSAHGTGGSIDVAWTVPGPGILTLQENSWAGWEAWVDGRPAPLLGGRWLSVAVPGQGRWVQFRYRPWDAPLGMLLCLIGLGLALYLWDRGPEEVL